MAALMTSVIDNPSKVAEYILNCKSMGIAILPPDINVGYAGFSVSEKGIHYGLSAIKSIGRSVIEAIVAERKENGPYTSLKDFIFRLSNKEVNKRTIENFIKSGALDCLEGTRKQKMLVYVQIIDEAARDKKNTLTGQMSLFDFVDEEVKASMEIQMPKVGEFEQSELLVFEKEVLGVYLSGHPLEECEERWRKAISHTSADFMLDEELGTTKVMDGEKAIIGGIISEKSVKLTKTSKQMAYLTIEDLLGTVEVIVFPRDYEQNASALEQDAKVFVQGRVSCEDDKPSRLICEKIIPFDQEKKELWIQFADKEAFQKQEVRMLNSLKAYEGDVAVVAYLAKEKQWKKYPPNRNISLTDTLLAILKQQFGEQNIKIRTIKSL
jgi:DNA polymerase-3 subunit alpha